MQKYTNSAILYTNVYTPHELRMKKLILKNNSPYLIEIEEDTKLNPGDVLIKVKSVGLCRTDLLVASGKIPAKEGLVLGHEFSGVVHESASEKFNKGDTVAVNPLLKNNQFMGLDVDGCLTEYIIVSDQKIVAYTGLSFKQAAYLEPVAASMAVLKANIPPNAKIAVWGFNRIAELTTIILKTFGFNVVQTTTLTPLHYDVIIETQLVDEDLQNILNSLKQEGMLIVKSRKKTPTTFYCADLVKKEITMKAVNYYDFNKSMRWLEKNHSLVDHLLGEELPMEDYLIAFNLANSTEAQKIFISI